MHMAVGVWLKSLSRRDVTLLFVCLFDLILYVPSTIFSVIKGRVFLGKFNQY